VESNNTIAVVKHVLVDPPSKQNGPFLEERSHLGEGNWLEFAQLLLDCDSKG